MFRIFLLAVMFLTCGLSSACAGIITYDCEEFRPSVEAMLGAMSSDDSPNKKLVMGEGDNSGMLCTSCHTQDSVSVAITLEWQFMSEVESGTVVAITECFPPKPPLRGLLRPA